MYFLAVFGLLSVAWDITARRSVGVRHWWRAGILKDGVVAGISMVGIALVVYVGSWWSWFTHREAYGRLWAEQNPDQGVLWLPPALRSFWKYHQDMWGVPQRPGDAALVLGAPARLDRAVAADVVLLPDRGLRPDRSGGPGRVRCGQLLAGDRRARQPGPVVVRGGGDHRRGRLAVPVPRLACGRRAVRHRRRLAAVVRLRAPHDLHVLLDRVRALGRAHAGLRHRPGGRTEGPGPARADAGRSSAAGCSSP